MAAFSDMVPASIVGKIVDRYVYEQWLGEVRKNPRIRALADLPVGGRGVFWPWGSKRGTGLYLQSADRYRAQAVLDNPKAKWEIYFPTRPGIGVPYVRRVR